jgi:predicted anti-sigma-YlaC factor YlaD
MTPSEASDARGVTAVLTSIAFVAIAGAFVAVRCVARAGLLQRCGADDFLIVCAVVMSAALTALIAVRE